MKVCMYMIFETHIYMHTHINTRIPSFSATLDAYILHTYMHAYIPEFLASLLCLNSLNTYIHVCIHTYIHVCIHTYIYVYIHTCIHTGILSFSAMLELTEYIHTYMHAYIQDTYIHACIHTGILSFSAMLKPAGRYSSSSYTALSATSMYVCMYVCMYV